MEVTLSLHQGSLLAACLLEDLNLLSCLGIFILIHLNCTHIIRYIHLNPEVPDV